MIPANKRRGMNLLPLIERELRVALRKRQPVRARFRMAAWCTAAALFFLLLGGRGMRATTDLTLHTLLCLVGLMVAFRTPQMIAGSFADERRNQTLGFLFLSGLSAGEIFLSKVLSAAMIAFNSLLAIFPLLALPFLTGGVSFELFLATVFGLPNLLLFALAVSLLASILTKDDGAAIILSRVLTVLICAASLLVYAGLIRFGAKPSPGWLWLSPAYGPYQLFAGLKAGTSAFWWNWILTLAWSLLCLTGAAFGLKRLWRRYQEGVEAGPLGKFWQHISHGNVGYRRCLKELWIDVNPYVWLAGRDRLPTMLAGAAVVGLILCWLICWTIWPNLWLRPFSMFLLALAINLALSWIVAYTAAKTVGDPRHDGSYELLLTTPLNPSDIVWGELEASRRLFHPVIWTVLILELILMLAGLTLRQWTLVTLAIYFLLWFYLANWTFRLGLRSGHILFVLWVGLNSARPTFAAWRAGGNRAWAWLWIVFFSDFSNVSPGFPTGSWQELFLVVLGACFVLGFRNKRQNKTKESADYWETTLVAQFREIVREPIPDPHDPRYKNWDVSQRFPWGWAAVQERIHERLVRQTSGRICTLPNQPQVVMPRSSACCLTFFIVIPPSASQIPVVCYLEACTKSLERMDNNMVL